MKKLRMEGALERLQEQLKTGKKPARDVKGHTTSLKTLLTEKDIKRINKEVVTLEARIKTA